MPDNEPTLGEHVRRLGDAVIRLEAVIASFATTYVMRETYNAHREADDRRLKELEKDNDNLTAFRRQVLLALAVAFIGILGTASIALLNFVAR